MQFMQIDADFIAQYQMNYGCGETTETNTSSQYSDDYWSNPPSDINSEEYRIWYERYCSYFYPQPASEASVASSSVDTSSTVGPDASSGSVNNSAVNSTTVTTTDAEQPSDTTDDTAAGNAGGKKRKKDKKGSVVNPKPAEPPGELQLVVGILWVHSIVQFSGPPGAGSGPPGAGQWPTSSRAVAQWGSGSGPPGAGQWSWLHGDKLSYVPKFLGL